MDEADLAGIVRVSERNNAAVSVTGLLVVGGRRFLQVLEGPMEAVMATYARIRADPRHRAIVELANEPISERAFGGWAMGYRRGGPANAAGTVDAAIATLIDPIADRTLRGYFTGFAVTHMTS